MVIGRREFNLMYFIFLLKMFKTEGWRDGPVLRMCTALVEDHILVSSNHLRWYSCYHLQLQRHLTPLASLGTWTHTGAHRHTQAHTETYNKLQVGPVVLILGIAFLSLSINWGTHITKLCIQNENKHQ